jgi:ribosomal protein L30E
MADTITHIQKALADEKVLFGLKECKKHVGTVKKVFIASNCSAQIKEDAQYYARINNIDCEVLAMTNDMLSIVCKKPYAINILCVTA